MSNEERRDSLADQAAAWIPPWQRPTPPRESTPIGHEPEDAADLGTKVPSQGQSRTKIPADETAPGEQDGGVGGQRAEAVEELADAEEQAETAEGQQADFGGESRDAAGDEPTGVVPARQAEATEAQQAGFGGESRDGAGDEPADVVPAQRAAAGGQAEPGGERAAVATDERAGTAGQVQPAEGSGAQTAEAGAPAAVAGEAATTRKRSANRARAVPEPAPVLDDAELRGALEAILLVVDEPVSELTLAQVLEQPAERVGPMLDEIAASYTAAGHGFELRRAAGGWRLYTRPEYATYVERFVLDGQSVRLTQAALETLAVVAYKQPVTRSRISAIRGVNCDGVIRTLVSRGLVEECGTETDSGAYLYRTTTMFLEKLGLNSLSDLPPLAPFLPDDVEELADATR